MFTGLIQKTGRIERFETVRDGSRIAVSCSPWDTKLVPGESVAVHGVCLTVADANDDGGFTCDVLAETIRRTSLGKRRTGSVVNLERALRPNDRLGGHFVQGHVDGTGCVESVGRVGTDTAISITCGQEMMRYVVEKGSIALDGVSLTVVNVSQDGFSVHIIPTTWEMTSLGKMRTGDLVNIETDILAKYVRHYMQPAAGTSGGLTLDKLRDAGLV